MDHNLFIKILFSQVTYLTVKQVCLSPQNFGLQSDKLTGFYTFGIVSFMNRKKILNEAG